MSDEHSTGVAGGSKVRALAGGSMAEGIIGLGAVTLGIISLANVAPTFLLAVGIIAAGTAILFEAGVIASRYSRLTGTMRIDEHVQKGGSTLLFLVGVSVIALGILGLIGVAPRWLVPISVILLGIGLILNSSMNARLTAFEITHSGMGSPETASERAPSHEMAREAGAFTTSMQAFVGLAVLTLGVLALVGVQPLTLSLVALIGVGGALFFNGTAAGALMGLRR